MTTVYIMITEQVGVIEKKCLEHHSMLSALQEPSNGATALKHLKQQVCESYPSYCAIFSIEFMYI